jgi:methionine biosynthesis protein MetW
MAMQQQVLPLTGMAQPDTGHYRGDHLLVAEMVERGSKVLDVGCGDGDLLQLLESRGIDGRGIELSREGVNRCVAKGLAVVQGDADTDLINYPDDAFDYVILSQTLQATRQPRVVLENLLRIGRRAIVSFPNFGFWRMRLQLLVGGHMPRTEHPFLHHQGFRAALRRDQRQDGARGRARSLRPPVAGEHALVVLEHVWRAGRVFAEPGGEGEVSPIRHSGARVSANPESRDSPMCNCTSEVWSFAPSRNDG